MTTATGSAGPLDSLPHGLADDARDFLPCDHEALALELARSRAIEIDALLF